MKRFMSSCSACGWESPTADTAEVAAVAGVAHLHDTHAPVLQARDVSFIHVWSFDQLQVVEGTTDIVLDVEPAAERQSSAEEPEPEEKHETQKSHKGTRGR